MRLLAFVIPGLYFLFGVEAVHASLLDAISHIFPFIIAQVVEDGFALEFNPTLKTRAIVIRHIFSKRVFMTERSIKPAKVALALAARLFR